MRAVALLLLALLAGCASPSAPADLGPPDHVVRMVDNLFDPATLEVGVGDVVQWRNDDRVKHTVTPVDAAAWGSAGSGSDEEDWLAANATWSWRFERAGTFVYYCIPHGYVDDAGVAQGQRGTIVVA